MWKMLMENSPLLIQHLFQLEGQTYRDMREEWCMMTCHPHMSQRTKLFASRKTHLPVNAIFNDCVFLFVGFQKTHPSAPRLTSQHHGLPFLRYRNELSYLQFWGPKKKGEQRKITIRLVEPREPDASGVDKETVSETEDEGEAAGHTFCPKIHREKILTMLENHYCAHPLIPGYGPQAVKVSEIEPYARCTCITKTTSFLKSPPGKLEQKRSMGTMGSFSSQLNCGFEDNNDLGKPVSLVTHKKFDKN